MSQLNTRLTLIQRISQSQDEESWEEFVHYYKRYLYVVVRNLNMNHHDTEEIIQTVEVFFLVWTEHHYLNEHYCIYLRCIEPAKAYFIIFKGGYFCLSPSGGTTIIRLNLEI